MNLLLEAIADTLLSGCGPSKDSPILRIFMILTMSIAGVCFVGVAILVIVLVRSLVAVPLVLFLLALASLSFWLVRRAKGCQ